MQHDTVQNRTFKVGDRIIFTEDNSRGTILHTTTDTFNGQMVRIYWDDGISSPWWPSNDAQLAAEPVND